MASGPFDDAHSGGGRPSAGGDEASAEAMVTKIIACLLEGIASEALHLAEAYHQQRPEWWELARFELQHISSEASFCADRAREFIERERTTGGNVTEEEKSYVLARHEHLQLRFRATRWAFRSDDVIELAL